MIQSLCIKMTIGKLFFLLTLAAASTRAQSSNPNVGANSKTDGATEDVTSSTGPNGYETPQSLA